MRRAVFYATVLAAAGAAGLARVSTSTGAFWLFVLWATWVAMVVWSFTRPAFSLFLAAFNFAMLVFVMLPATAAQYFGRTSIGGNDYSAGVVAAMQISAVAEISLFAGAVAARSVWSCPVFYKLRPVLGARRLDRASWGALGVGILGVVLLGPLGGANLRNFFVFTTKAGYGTLSQGAAAAKVGFLLSLQAVGGLCLSLVALRFTSTSSRRWTRPILVALLALVLLSGEGQRGILFVPVFAAGVVWLKTTKRAFVPRRLAISGAMLLLLFASIAGIARGAAGHREFSVGAVVTEPFGPGNNLFLPLAGLAQTVPSGVPYLGGSSYLETLVFPIPRALWSGKPEGSIAATTAVIDPGNSGLAFPEFGEMYANFGIVGVVVGSCFLGLVVEGLWARFSRTRSVREALFLSISGAVLLQVFVRGALAPLMTTYLGLLVAAGIVCRRRSPMLSPRSSGGGAVTDRVHAGGVRVRRLS